MEDKYGHFFDYVLVNTDMDRAYEELLAEINRIEVAPQWVPVAWTRWWIVDVIESGKNILLIFNVVWIMKITRKF